MPLDTVRRLVKLKYWVADWEEHENQTSYPTDSR